MKNKKEDSALWVAKTALVFFVVFFVWTFFSGDLISPERKNIFLLFLGIGNVLLLLGILQSDAEETADDETMENGKLVIYDGTCGFCTKSVIFILKRNSRQNLWFAANQSSYGKARLSEHGLLELSGDTLVYIESGNAYTYSEAALRICKQLRFPWSLLQACLIIPAFLRDPVYKLIAKLRYRLAGRTEACMIPDERHARRFIED